MKARVRQLHTTRWHKSPVTAVPACQRQPLSTDAACALLKDTLGIDPRLDGNMLKMLRAVERAHGIGPNAPHEGPGAASSRTVPLDAELTGACAPMVEKK